MTSRHSTHLSPIQTFSTQKLLSSLNNLFKDRNMSVGVSSFHCTPLYGNKIDNHNSNYDRFFSMNEIMEMIAFMVSHTFIMLADQSFQQHIGIPMGTNSGGNLIDCYLFQYELDFMLQLHRLQLWTLFSMFCHTMRYLDDIHVINNPHFHTLLYTDMEVKTIKGIYPRYALTLLLVHRAASVQYMDTIVAMANNQQAKHLQHKLFTRSF